MKNGKPDYYVMKKAAPAGVECTVRDQGTLGGFCGGCGLMRMKHEKGECPKCGSTERTNIKPEAAGRIVAIGYTRFTQYTIGNEAI